MRVLPSVAIILTLALGGCGSDEPKQSYAEVVFWDSVKDDVDPGSFQAYLDRYPNGQFAAIARERRDYLRAHPLPPTDAVEPRAPTFSATTLPPASDTAPPTAALPGPSAPPMPGTAPAPASPAPASPTPAPAPGAEADYPTSTSLLHGGDATGLYNLSFGFLRGGDLPRAQQGLEEFLRRYPDDALAGNARYWLGEIYFERGDNDRAAIAFADVYKSDPNGARAPDALYKLGLSLDKAGRHTEACSTFAQLRRAYPVDAERLGVAADASCG
jgi:tol-pal system protein YbgF